jgi:hypothetical protein
VTQLYTRGFYDLVVDQSPLGLAALAARQALLFGLLALAVRAAIRPANPETEASAAVCYS